MNEEKPFLGFSSFRAEPERKLSRRRFCLPARNFGIHGSRTTPDSLRPKTGEENHRILTNGSSSGNMPARTPCPKGKATTPSTFKGGREEQSRRRLSSETTRLNGSTGHPLPGNNRNAARLSSPQETNHALQSGTKPVLQSDSELFVMIGLVADNRKGPVKLQIGRASCRERV